MLHDSVFVVIKGGGGVAHKGGSALMILLCDVGLSTFLPRIVAFHKKCDAFNVSLVLDTNGLGDTYQGPGYHHPQRVPSSPQGMDSYPAILSYPGVSLCTLLSFHKA